MKKMFIKFCWGSDRIPQSMEAFKRSATSHFKIGAMTKQKQDQDNCLISADTCFFKLHLPEYSSFEVLKNKILTSINWGSGGMNKDDHADNEAAARRNRRPSDY
jgi:hypothetical protein